MTRDSFFMHSKREYWEAKNWLIGLPLLLSILILATVIILTETIGRIESELNHSITDSEQGSLILDFGTDAQPIDNSNHVSEQEDDDSRINFSIHSADNINGLSLLQLFLNFGWVAALFYLLTSLYSDRKDSSILFWKSLPINDSEQVLSKLFFAVVSFPLVALLFGWMLLSLFLVLDATYYSAQNLDIIRSIGEHSWLKIYLVAPLTVYGLSLLNGFPIITLILLVSALAKRSPFLWLALPLIGLILVERWLIHTSYTEQWLASHLPFANSDVLDEISANFSGFLFHTVVRNAVDFVINISLGALFIAASIWLRKHRFEI